MNYFYNKEGIRTKKVVNGVEINYFVENSNIVFEEINGNVLYYMRTDENELIGFIYNDETYYYKKNYQGDILGIYDSNYNLICTYEYDSYGAIVSIKDALGNKVEDETHIANINPYRYRSYYYDKETGYYYLNSRYYNPIWGRFLNADNYLSFNKINISLNLYVYCENNPILSYDALGNFSFKKIGETISNGFKKTINSISKTFSNVKNATSNILNAGKNLVNNAKKHFVAEAGYGVGAGIKIQNTGVVISSTANSSYKNGKKTQSTSSKGEASILGYKISLEGKHIDDGLHDNYFVFFDKDQTTCNNTNISYTFGRDNKNITYETSNYNSKFFGINIEGYLGAGGYIKIGFEY